MKYDFIEIGTSDFYTCVENANDEIGLSIEPLKVYLDKLPDKKNVTKVNCAISTEDTIVDVFYVDPEDIGRYGLPSWLRGCNSIIKPHPSTNDVLVERNLTHLLKTTTCESITWKTLVSRFNVESVEYLKIDTEGHDCFILNNILDSEIGILPKNLRFEHNILTDEKLYQETIKRLINVGYDFINGGEEVVLKLNENR